jgi:hypothetical protein
MPQRGGQLLSFMNQGLSTVFSYLGILKAAVTLSEHTHFAKEHPLTPQHILHVLPETTPSNIRRIFSQASTWRPSAIFYESRVVH